MAPFKSVITSLRLRTLPLSLAGVILGILLAVANYEVEMIVVVFVLLTTVCLQILSNLSNELGDNLNGTDTAERQGPQYALDSGNMSVGDMKLLIVIFGLLCVVFGILMILFSFGTLFCKEAVCLMILGAAAIVGAIKYTLGKNPYGYRGLGDISVFIFFGLTSVVGSYFVVAHTLPLSITLPASTMGLFSVGVLNVNNIRDMKTDVINRVTVAIKLGLYRARVYQTILIVLGWGAMIVYSSLLPFALYRYLYVVTLPLYIVHLKGVWTKEDRALDSMLPLLVISSFLFSIFAGVSCL